MIDNQNSLHRCLFTPFDPICIISIITMVNYIIKFNVESQYVLRLTSGVTVSLMPDTRYTKENI